MNNSNNYLPSRQGIVVEKIIDEINDDFNKKVSRIMDVTKLN